MLDRAGIDRAVIRPRGFGPVRVELDGVQSKAAALEKLPEEALGRADVEGEPGLELVKKA